MTLQIGRIGLATASGGDGLTFAEPMSWSQSGREVTISGIHVAASNAAAVWFRDNLVELAASDDEPYVPVTSSAVSDLDGFYRVRAASARFESGSLGPGHLMVPWSATLERAVHPARPRVEVSSVVTGLVNSMGVTSGKMVQGFPSQTLTRGLITATGSETRDTATGDVEARYYGTVAPGATYSGVSAMSYLPASHYKGSASISTGDGVISGRRDGPVSDTVTVSNGLIRLIPAASTIELEWFNGSTWNSGRLFQLWSGTQITFHRWAILRNSPEECVVRVYGYITSAYAGAISGQEQTVDIGLRRGDLWARLLLSGEGSNTCSIRFDTVTACTSTTWGIRSTATIDSEYVVIGSDEATTKDGVNGRLTTPAGEYRVAFSLGVSLGGLTTGDPNGSDSVAQQGYAVWGETQRVVV